MIKYFFFPQFDEFVKYNSKHENPINNHLKKNSLWRKNFWHTFPTVKQLVPKSTDVIEKIIVFNLFITMLSRIEFESMVEQI